MPEADAEKESGLPVGEYLKSVREARGLELEQVSRVTKISRNYLVAIEQGEFEKLPNAAYIKGFLRLYASFLSLSGDEVVRRYESALPTAPRPQPEAKGEAKAEAKAGGGRMEYVGKAKAAGPGRWLIPALLLALVILAALFLAEPEQRRETLVEPAPQVSQPAPAPAPVLAPVTAPVQPQLSSAHPAQAAAPQAAEPPPQTAPASGIVLRMRFNQDSWLSITIDDSVSQRYDLKAGDVIEWKGSRLFVIDLGDGGAVEAEFNGRPLKALGQPGQPAHLELKAQ